MIASRCKIGSGEAAGGVRYAARTEKGKGAPRVVRVRRPLHRSPFRQARLAGLEGGVLGLRKAPCAGVEVSAATPETSQGSLLPEARGGAGTRYARSSPPGRCPRRGEVPLLFSCRSTAWGELPAGLNLRLPWGLLSWRGAYVWGAWGEAPPETVQVWLPGRTRQGGGRRFLWLGFTCVIFSRSNSAASGCGAGMEKWTPICCICSTRPAIWRARRFADVCLPLPLHNKAVGACPRPPTRGYAVDIRCVIPIPFS